MKFGISKEIITPPFNVNLACSGIFDKPFKKIHDDVFVRCFVIDDEKTKVVFFAFDLLFHDRSLNFELENYANEKYGLEKSSVVISSTHSHLSLSTKGYGREFYSEEFEAFLLERAKTCLDRAMCSMFEGSIEHTTFNAEFNVSRRGVVDGKFCNSPALDRARDTEFSLLIIRDIEKNVRSVVMNYPCHPVFYPARDSVSGEFPARVCQLIDAEYYGCISMYFQSSGGDVRPIVTAGEDGKWIYGFGFKDVNNFAKDIYKAVISEVDKERESIDVSLGSDAFVMDFPMDGADFSYFEKEYEFYKDGPISPNHANARYIVNGAYDSLKDSLSVYGQTIKLSEDIYIATIGGEPTSGIKNVIKKAFGNKKVFFIGYTDDCAYLVNDKELEEGGYEAECHLEYCLKGPFKKGIDENLISGYTNSLKNIK